MHETTPETYKKINDSEWQWHQLDHMQAICASIQTDNHTSTLQVRTPFWCPTNSVEAL